MAIKLIENLRSRVPYIARLHRRIDELQHKLAEATANPELRPVHGSHDLKIVAQFRQFLRLLRPYQAANAKKQRFGGNADGGYVLLDDFGDAQIAISLGIGDEVSWDLDIANRGLRVIQFDHTVDHSPQNHPNFVFNHARVVGRSQEAGDITLSEVL